MSDLNVIEILAPANFKEERKYLYDTVFNQYLGIKFNIKFSHRDDLVIFREGSNKKIRVFDSFFNVPKDKWLTEYNFPCDVRHSTILDEDLHLIYPNKQASNYIEKREETWFLNWDLFGGIFLFLTRYEEIVKSSDYDKFGRFPLEHSISNTLGINDHPIVDQYLSFFRKLLIRIWEDMIIPEGPGFRCNITHDIDVPFKFLDVPFKKILTRTIKNVDDWHFINLGQNIRKWFSVNFQNSSDPYFCLDEIMDISETANVSSHFYFMSGQTSLAHDPFYNMETELFSSMLKNIHDRGHIIGLHPSFNTFKSPKLIRNELLKLKDICKSNGIEQEQWGGRQHFLRCIVPETLRYYEKAGLRSDSTLGFAEKPGFRCGTSKPFPIFDLKERRTLNVIEYPLIVMEASVLDKRYLGLKSNLPEAFDVMKSLKDKCRKYSGVFTLLWHNNRFVDPGEKELYKAILKA